MNNKVKKFVSVIVLLLLVVGIGYATIRLNLKINGVTTIKNNNFIVRLDNVAEKSGSVTPTKAATLGTDEMSVSFDVTLENPGEYYGFTVDLINEGTLNAAIDSFNMTELSTNQKKYFIYEVKYSDGTDIKMYDLLARGETKKIDVLLKYRDDVEEYPPTSETVLNLSFSLGYIETERTDDSVLRYSLNEHVQLLPEDLTSSTNLYNVLTIEDGYYNAESFILDNNDVVSVTIPVLPGDKIKANSFNEVGNNGQKGIRVTYLYDNNIVKSLSIPETNSEYLTNGYLTVPEGVNAVCVPWWRASDSNWLNVVLK